MKALITYDLKSDATDHNEVFLYAAETEGLLFVVKGSLTSRIYRLPQTTVWGRFRSVDDAIAAFDRAIALTSRVVEHDVKVTKRLTVSFEDQRALSNVYVPVDPNYVGINDYETARLHQMHVAPFKISRAMAGRLNLASLDL